MSTKDAIIANAIKVIDTESNAIKNLAQFVDDAFAEAVEYIYNSNGRVIITGVGKSAIIGTKIFAK